MRGKSTVPSLMTAAAIAGGLLAAAVVLSAQSSRPKPAAPQKVDTEYTAKIQQ